MAQFVMKRLFQQFNLTKIRRRLVEIFPLGKAFCPNFATLILFPNKVGTKTAQAP
jgi:hypothetical protein